ncbi:MAG: hypothetical protein IIY76_05300 [Erysipelotrichaceae bacterium]|nr:hypothetical protein [Erysipelotrichaceae bacterium]
MKQKPMGMRIGESVFCIGYLCFVFIAACIFGAKGDQYSRLCMLMCILLGGGDAFHLIPRIIINTKGETEDKEENARRSFWLGLGNLISSITMTLFYVLLFKVMEERGQIQMPSMIYTSLIVLTILRIALCLFKQNKWFTGGDPSWGIIRNIPFVVIGIITIIYLLAYCHAPGLAVPVFLSFLCYMAVVIGTKKKPMLGMLMIPKTICYIWMIAILLK